MLPSEPADDCTGSATSAAEAAVAAREELLESMGVMQEKLRFLGTSTRLSDADRSSVRIAVHRDNLRRNAVSVEYTQQCLKSDAETVARLESESIVHNATEFTREWQSSHKCYAFRSRTTNELVWALPSVPPPPPQITPPPPPPPSDPETTPSDDHSRKRKRSTLTPAKLKPPTKKVITPSPLSFLFESLLIVPYVLHPQVSSLLEKWSSQQKQQQERQGTADQSPSTAKSAEQRWKDRLIQSGKAKFNANFEPVGSRK